MLEEKATERESFTEGPFPAVPLTLEGWSILHQMFRVRWASWKALPPREQKEILKEAGALLTELERGDQGPSAAFALLGHKGDLLLLHFRRTFDELGEVELRLANLALADFLEETTSYLSVVELGLYEATVRLYAALEAKGVRPGTEEWQRAVETELEGQRQALAPRLWPPIPFRRYFCFYPMGRRRGEARNWYRLPMEERQRMLRQHGLTGRRYSRQVTQIISGSMGLDDWEWGVDLFADEPLVFKKLLYEMRFDEASAVYALFGPFYLGLRFPAAELATFLGGKLPAWRGSE